MHEEIGASFFSLESGIPHFIQDFFCSIHHRNPQFDHFHFKRLTFHRFDVTWNVAIPVWNLKNPESFPELNAFLCCWVYFCFHSRIFDLIHISVSSLFFHAAALAVIVGERAATLFLTFFFNCSFVFLRWAVRSEKERYDNLSQLRCLRHIRRTILCEGNMAICWFAASFSLIRWMKNLCIYLFKCSFNLQFIF